MKIKSNFSIFFHYFNEKACRWVKTEQEPCTESADQSISISSATLPTSIATASTLAATSTTATTSTTTSTSTTTTTTSTTSTSTTITTTIKTTSTTPFINQTAILIEIQDGDNAETVIDLVNGQNGDQNGNATDYSVTYDPHHDSCEILDSDWICSNGPINLSLCFKICSDDAIEHKRCICKESSCSWYQKGNACSIETTPVPNLTSPMNSGAMNDVFSTSDQSNLSNEDPQGNSLFSNFPSLDPKMDLMSLIHQINVNSSGNINVNFQLR